MARHISDYELPSRLRCANDDARDHFRTTVTLIIETQTLLRDLTRFGSALIARQPGEPF